MRNPVPLTSLGVLGTYKIELATEMNEDKKHDLLQRVYVFYAERTSFFKCWSLFVFHCEFTCVRVWRMLAGSVCWSALVPLLSSCFALRWGGVGQTNCFSSSSILLHDLSWNPHVFSLFSVNIFKVINYS